MGVEIMAKAGPGEICLSRTVKDLVAGSGFTFEEASITTLGGVLGEWPLFKLVSK
jgi:hypothetical protein